MPCAWRSRGRYTSGVRRTGLRFRADADCDLLGIAALAALGLEALEVPASNTGARRRSSHVSAVIFQQVFDVALVEFVDQALARLGDRQVERQNPRDWIAARCHCGRTRALA